MNDEVEWAAKIFGGLIAAVVGLDQWRKRSSNTTRQLQEDSNANTFYADMAKRVTELDAQNQSMWKQIVETQQKAADAKHEANLWQYKFGVVQDSNKLLQERNDLKEAALKSALDEIERLKEAK